MSISGCVRTPTAMVLVGCLVLIGPLGRMARADLVSTEAVLASAAGDPGARAPLRALVDRGDVRAELAALGISPEQALARIDALSDAEVAKINGELNELPAGGSAVGAVVGAALLVFLVLLLTDILGYTDIFPFVKKRAQP